MTLQELLEIANIQQTPEASYLRGLGQPVPQGVEIVGPSASFQNDPAYQPRPDVTAQGAATRLTESGVTGQPEDQRAPGTAGLEWASVLMSLGAAVAQAIAASKLKRQKQLIAIS